jgi:hypothetical protein
MFWTAEEYEAALIIERRAQGRYNSRWPVIMFIGCAVMVAAAVLLLS